MSRIVLTPWDIVRTQPFEAGGFIDANPSVGSSNPIRLFIDENGDEKDARKMLDSTTQKAQIKDFLPSLYTGGMRKLMQVSHLRGETWFNSAKHDQLLPGWADTFGVFISAPVEGVCNRYIIRICSAGIFRIPINFAKPLPSTWEADEAAGMALSAEGAAEAVGRFWSAGNFDITQAVQIGDAPAMYSGHGGFYAACGWAFDSDGHNAVNTAWRYDPTDESGARKMGVLFKVTITESGGVPTSAASTEQESGRLVNPLRDDAVATEDNAILQVATAIPGVCATFTCWPGFSNMGGTTATAPVFAYYDSSDVLQVVRFDYDGTTNAHIVTTGPDLPTRSTIQDTKVGDTTPEGGMSLDDRSIQRVPSLTTQTSRNGYEIATARFSSLALDADIKAYGGGYTHKSYVLNGSSGFITQSSWNVSIYGYNALEDDFEVGRNNYGFANYGWPVRCSATRYTQEVESSTENTTAHDTIILHGYDRTSYIHYRYHRAIYTGRDIDIINAPIARGTSDPEIFINDVWTALGAQGANVIGYQYHLTSGQNIPALAYEVTGGSSRTDPDTSVTTIVCKLVIDNTTHDLDYSGDTEAAEVYLAGESFTYTASCSWFQTSRIAYDTDLNGSAVAEGFGYATCANRLHAFLGAF
jgi:hypothetical protein